MNPFRKKVQDPPPEVSAHTVKPEEPLNSHRTSHGWDVRARLEHFAAAQADKLRDKARPNANIEPLPVTVIPAPIRMSSLLGGQSQLESPARSQNPQMGPTSNPMGVQIAENTALHHHLRPQRASDPYTPQGLNRESITQHGSISFVNSVQQDRDRRAGGPSAAFQPVEEQDSQGGQRSSSVQIHSRSSPRRYGLPFVSIPAPPRQPRAGRDE